ncbi:MAG TPA: nuclear transport factor 2 family protein [Mycobacteriales bacterium]|nr:nuclear transport factor 2 family protein [Mycobacteriales bacterium]
MSDHSLAGLQKAADLVEMQTVLAKYATAVDARRWELLDEVFVPGSVIDFTRNGGDRSTYPDILDYLRPAMAIFATCQHYFMNFQFDVTGDTGGGRFYCATQMVTIVAEGEEKLLADGGFYDVTFTRTNDGWRVQELVAGLTWLDGEWPEGVPRPAWYGVSTDRY